MSLEDIVISVQRDIEISFHDSTELTRRELVKQLARLYCSRGLCLCLCLELGLGLCRSPLLWSLESWFFGYWKGKGKWYEESTQIWWKKVRYLGAGERALGPHSTVASGYEMGMDWEDKYEALRLIQAPLFFFLSHVPVVVERLSERIRV